MTNYFVHIAELGDQRFYFMQLGYLEFLDSNYTAADTLLQFASKKIGTHNPCHLVLTKQMELFYHMGKIEKK